MRDTTSAYVSIRQHTSAYVSVQLTAGFRNPKCPTHEPPPPAPFPPPHSPCATPPTHSPTRQFTSVAADCSHHSSRLPASKACQQLVKLSEACQQQVKLLAPLLALACWEGVRQHTSAYVSIRQHTSAYVSIRQHTSAYVSIRQQISAYVSIRERLLPALLALACWEACQQLVKHVSS
jgi:hypothetical protein